MTSSSPPTKTLAERFGSERNAGSTASIDKADLSPGTRAPPSIGAFDRLPRIAPDLCGSAPAATASRASTRAPVRPARIGTPHPPAASATTTSPACWWIVQARYGRPPTPGSTASIPARTRFELTAPARNSRRHITRSQKSQAAHCGSRALTPVSTGSIRSTEEFTLYKNTLDDDRTLAHDRVYSVYVDRSGAVWAATYGGLDRFNPADRSFVHYTVRDGLPANTTLGVLEDDRGYLWVTTTNGLAQFDPRTRTSTNYDPSDGLPTDLFSVLVAAAKSRSGELFFGSYNGLIAVSPDRLRINHVPPPVAIEQITADRKTYDATQGLRLPSAGPRPGHRLHGAQLCRP